MPLIGVVMGSKSDAEAVQPALDILKGMVSSRSECTVFTDDYSATQNGLSRSVDIKFTSSSELIQVPVERRVNTLVFAPETAAVNQAFRVFVQTTSDGLLIGNDPNELLGTSHVHLPTGQVVSLSNSFQMLHDGLFFIDFTPQQIGTYVFHVVTFSKGTVSHGSAATLVLSQDISGVAEQVIKLNSVLEQTSDELDKLKTEISGFGSTLESASENIDSSVKALREICEKISARKKTVSVNNNAKINIDGT